MTSINKLVSLADPKSEIREGRIIALGFGTALLMSAVVFRLDAAAHATGEVVVDGRQIIIQHREGGNIGAILVREGSVVRQGDVLIRLDAASVSGSVSSLADQAVQLASRRARLTAEVQGRRTLGQVQLNSGNDSEFDAERLALSRQAQQRELTARWATLDAQIAVLDQRLLRSREQRRGQEEQAQAAIEQIRLIDEELALLRPLAQVGHVSQTRIRSMERARADLEGQLSAFRSGTNLSMRDGEDLRLQALQTRKAFAERAEAELAAVETQLADLVPRLHAARDQLRRTEVRAPVAGTVVRMTVGTLGAVLAPGQKILEIVPTNVAPRIHARVAPNDADDLRTGQVVRVRFPGLHESQATNLKGRLLRLSADRLSDDRTGSSYYLAEISLPEKEIQFLQKLRGKHFTLRSGTPAEISFSLRKRSALSYLLEPLAGRFWEALDEQ